MVRILAEGHRMWPGPPAACFPWWSRASDEPTADVLVQRLTVHEQAGLMLRAMLED